MVSLLMYFGQWCVRSMLQVFVMQSGCETMGTLKTGALSSLALVILWIGKFRVAPVTYHAYVWVLLHYSTVEECCHADSSRNYRNQLHFDGYLQRLVLLRHRKVLGEQNRC
ncbi:hypothetical protein CBL_00237 [Carabus blaptoides fortunei]